VKKRFSEEQIIGFLRGAAAGLRGELHSGRCDGPGQRGLDGRQQRDTRVARPNARTGMGQQYLYPRRSNTAQGPLSGPASGKRSGPCGAGA